MIRFLHRHRGFLALGLSLITARALWMHFSFPALGTQIRCSMLCGITALVLTGLSSLSGTVVSSDCRSFTHGDPH